MKKWAVAITVVLFLLSGCNDKEKANGPKQPEKEESEEVIQEEVDHELPYHYPLTGLGSEIETDGRAVAVMINNHPKARPQSGLHKADVVYELLAEGDVTRFLAVFQSEKPDKMGPVRSARDYYIDLAKGLDALFIAHGYSEEARELLESDFVDNLNGMVYDGTLFKRASFREAPHNSYITYGNVLKGAKEKKYSMNQSPPAFQFLSEEDSKSVTGNNAISVKISYSASGVFNSTYEYDELVGKYKRYSDGDQTTDYETKEPILLDNLFIIETTHQVIDEAAHKEIDLQSGGSGYLVQKGKAMEVEWKNDNGLLVPIRNGEVVPFVQGKTWVNVIPTKPGLQSSVSFNVN
ncbi:hypothetical protein QFZ28_004879 [Neobacillus niacini]|jgi:hypothetical protein|uniref:DUF3048 domain-containing protein n=1 Tax=Neobacillus niacini TaxID=86668 RepID=UPI00278AB531|nr:DUF3048 domain-containing protein [Neobacillus niacini]MDQ1004339.1 hypothetical protein [Neobacillus niacini]